MKAAWALAVAILPLAGCLADRDGVGADGGCSVVLDPGDVVFAVTEGGSGPRVVTLKAGDEHMPVIAWWDAGNATVATVKLIATDTQHILTLHAPADRDLHLLAGRDTTVRPPRWELATSIPAGPDPVTVHLADPMTGLARGTWSSPASIGFGPDGAAWQAHDLEGLGADVPLDRLELILTWVNGANGGADLGVGVASGPATFSYTNSEYQATAGSQTERRILEGAELATLGWGNGTAARAGPSISTGGFASTGIAYELAWQAFLAPLGGREGHVCDMLGPVRERDVTAGDA